MPNESPLKVLSWNIFMMPSFVGLDLISPANKERAELIGDVLQHTDNHIICFQKAFDEAARDVIQSKLKSKFPFITGPINPTSEIAHTNSGLWILSNIRLDVLTSIDFSVANGWEKMSRKGAVILAGVHEGKAFQIVDTHLQGDGDPAAGNDYTDTRMQQLKEIREKILQPNIKASVPQIICGDMSIGRFRNDTDESANYLKMLHLLDAENGSSKRITLNDDNAVNDMARYDTKKKKEEDYILSRNAHGVRISRDVTKIRGEWQVWPGKLHNDLSYRYAVEATINL